jgi:prepilin-type processing-associated H-X9-DG protein
MNHYVGDLQDVSDNDVTCYRSEKELVIPTPDSLFIFTDGHEDVIESSPIYFQVTGGAPPPASRHSRGAMFGFADGHVELHKWKDPRTIVPPTGVTYSAPLITGDPDIAWLVRHGTYSKNYWPTLPPSDP